MKRQQIALNLGIDFGTQYTKVCCRDVGRGESVVVCERDATGGPLPALIHTRVAILSDGSIITGADRLEWAKAERSGRIKRILEYLKMNLAALELDSTWAVGMQRPRDQAELIEGACAVFLADVLRRSRQWILETWADRLHRREPDWAAFLGVPVRYLDSPARARFETVAAMAWYWADRSLALPRSVGELVDEVRSFRARKRSPTGFVTCAEIAAAIRSFIIARDARTGLYGYFDIGAGTVDGVTFEFTREEGEPRVTFYSGEVAPLGVAKLCETIGPSIGVDPMQVRKGLFDEDATRALSYREEKRFIQKLVARVVVGGRRKDRHGWAGRWRERNGFGGSQASLDPTARLPIFVGGGGKNSWFYRAAVVDTHEDFQHASLLVPPYELRNVKKPADLEMSGVKPTYFHRFAIAYGLSAGSDIEVIPPSEVRTIPPPPPRPATEIVGQEQV